MTNSAETGQGTITGATDLVKDPVCGMDVDPHDAASLRVWCAHLLLLF